jgi:NADH-quinone oxidoreductase subunit N
MSDYTIDGFNGLGKTQPVLAFAVTIFLLSLTGIPLTAGFQGKFYMLLAAVENGKHLWLVIAAVIFAAISAYYYFRIIQAMYFREVAKEEENVTFVTSSFKLLLIVCCILIIVIGIYPELVVGWLYH